MPNIHKKIVIAVGGTGGHVFPAQAFAEELLSIDKGVTLLFAGAGLSSNAYFNKERFSYRDILSSTPFGKKRASSLFQIAKGYFQALKLLRQEKADLVVGFGSYHSFPILLAARSLQLPYVLFEANAIPGKVIKLFSKKAKFTAVQLPQAKEHLKGTFCDVALPMWLDSHQRPSSKEEAKKAYGLDPHLFTILVFGGSQGALAINRTFKEAASLLGAEFPFQVIHILGRKDSNEAYANAYKSFGIRAAVKPFEENMARAWSAADMAICRSGASTVAEMLHFTIPSILVPYPHATDNHQLINAKFFAERKAAVVIEEKALKAACLKEEIEKIAKESTLPLVKNLQTLKESRLKTLACSVKDLLKGS